MSGQQKSRALTVTLDITLLSKVLKDLAQPKGNDIRRRMLSVGGGVGGGGWGVSTFHSASRWSCYLGLGAKLEVQLLQVYQPAEVVGQPRDLRRAQVEHLQVGQRGYPA